MLALSPYRGKNPASDPGHEFKPAIPIFTAYPCKSTPLGTRLEKGSKLDQAREEGHTVATLHHRRHPQTSLKKAVVFQGDKGGIPAPEEGRTCLASAGGRAGCKACLCPLWIEKNPIMWAAQALPSMQQSPLLALLCCGLPKPFPRAVLAPSCEPRAPRVARGSHVGARTWQVPAPPLPWERRPGIPPLRSPRCCTGAGSSRSGGQGKPLPLGSASLRTSRVLCTEDSQQHPGALPGRTSRERCRQEPQDQSGDLQEGSVVI